MKKINKSVLYILITFLSCFIFINCTNDSDTPINIQSSNLYNTKSSFYTYEQSVNMETLDGKQYSGYMFVTVNENNGELVKIEFSQNLYDAGIGLNPDPIDFAAEVSSFADDEENVSHSDCIQNCWDTLVIDGVKQDGFGACRFKCWTKTTVRVLKAVAKISLTFVAL